MSFIDNKELFYRSKTSLLIDELKDIYSAEKQITRALPKMAKAAKSPELKQAFETLASGEAIINRKLADLLQAQAGDSIRVRIYKPGILPHDAPMGGALEDGVRSAAGQGDLRHRPGGSGKTPASG